MFLQNMYKIIIYPLLFKLVSNSSILVVSQRASL